MVRLPALCTECGAVYPSPLRAGESGADNAFSVPVPCPGCGSGGKVPAESLSRTTAVVEALREVAIEPERAEALFDELEAGFRDAGTREEAVLDGLRRVPGLGRAVGALPGDDPERMAAAVRLARVAAEVVRGAGEETSSRELAERVIEEAYERYAPERPGASGESPVDRARARLGATGRNEPCPCGSGEKYKRCHWLEDRREARGQARS